MQIESVVQEVTYMKIMNLNPDTDMESFHWLPLSTQTSPTNGNAQQVGDNTSKTIGTQINDPTTATTTATSA